MEKKELFYKLKKIIDGEKYFRFQNKYWKVNENETIDDGFDVITWENFFKIYDKKNEYEKSVINSEITEKGKTDDEKINLFIKILIDVSKKNNFYNLLKDNLTPNKINVLIKEYYYSGFNRVYGNNSLLAMFTVIKNYVKLDLKLFFKLNDSKIFNEILYESYFFLKDDIISYMIDNEIYDKFINSFVKTNKFFKSFDEYYNFKINHKDDITNFFIGPFSWHISEDGFDFWKKNQEDFTKFIIKKLITPL